MLFCGQHSTLVQNFLGGRVVSVISFLMLLVSGGWGHFCLLVARVRLPSCDWFSNYCLYQLNRAVYMWQLNFSTHSFEKVICAVGFIGFAFPSAQSHPSPTECSWCVTTCSGNACSKDEWHEAEAKLSAPLAFFFLFFLIDPEF